MVRLIIVLGLVGAGFFEVNAQNSNLLEVQRTDDTGIGEEMKPLVVLQIDDQLNIELPDQPADGSISMSQIPMNWIESITMLSDSEDLAAYGEKGRDGVLLITLKEGWKQDELFKSIIPN